MSLKNKTAITGIGQTEYSKGLGRPELSTAVEASRKAIEDAGLTPKDIDGIVRFDMEATTEEALHSVVGTNDLTFFAETGYGGGGGAATIALAAQAVATGQANHVLCFRSRNRGKLSASSAQAGRPWEKQSMLVGGHQQYHIPFGMVSPVQQVAMLTRRHMHEFGTKAEHLGAIAVTQRDNATRNPAAVMRQPITVEDYLNARWIAEPMRLFDCCLETDGAAALVVSSAEWARNCPNPPAYLLAVSQGMAYMTTGMDQLLQGRRLLPHRLLRRRQGAVRARRRRLQRHRRRPALRRLQHRRPSALGRLLLRTGQRRPLRRLRRHRFPDGEIPINTSGAGLSEVYLHGFNLMVEAVKQIRGTSTSQVKDVELSLYTSAAPVPSSAFLLSKNP